MIFIWFMVGPRRKIAAFFVPLWCKCGFLRGHVRNTSKAQLEPLGQPRSFNCKNRFPHDVRTAVFFIWMFRKRRYICAYFPTSDNSQ